MPAYLFVIRETASWSEKVGSMDLSDDTTAIAFGNGVMLDLMLGAARRYTGSIKDITQDSRVVANVRFK